MAPLCSAVAANWKLKMPWGAASVFRDWLSTAMTRNRPTASTRDAFMGERMGFTGRNGGRCTVTIREIAPAGCSDTSAPAPLPESGAGSTNPVFLMTQVVPQPCSGVTGSFTEQLLISPLFQAQGIHHELQCPVLRLDGFGA